MVQLLVLAQHSEYNERGEKFFSNFDMMSGRVVFCPIVSKICFARMPKKFELLLAFPVAEPVETHVHGFGTFWLYLTVNDGIRHGIVSLDWGGRLFMPHLFQNYANVNCFARHDIQCSQLGFVGGRHDMFDDVGDIQNGAIVSWNLFIKREKEVATGAAACLGLAEIACITVDGKFHVTTFVCEYSVFLSGQKI